MRFSFSLRIGVLSFGEINASTPLSKQMLSERSRRVEVY